RELLGRRVAEGGPDGGPDGGPVDGTGDVDGAPSGGGGTATAVAARRTVRTDQVITLAAFVAVALVALVFERNIGFTAITAAVILTALFPKEQKGAITQIAWSTVLLV